MSKKSASDYIIECNNLGITNKSQICDRAKQRIEEINKILHEADTLRIEKLNLTNVLQILGDDSVKRRRSVLAPIVDSGLNNDDNEAVMLRINICKLIEQHPGGLTNRDIIQKVGSYQEDQKIVRALKYLGERGIIARDSTPERLVIPGNNWEDRPVE
jgi:hypothetical protein